MPDVVEGPNATINVQNVDIDGTTQITIDSESGGISIDGTDDSNLTVTGSAKDLDLAVAGGGTQELRLASAGTGTSAISLTASAGGLALLASGNDSSFRVQDSGKDLDLEVSGGGTQELRLASAGTGASAIHLNASGGGINVDSADTIDIDAADEITIDTTSADGHIAITSAHTAGQSILISANANAGSILDIDAGIVTMDVQAGISLDGADDSNLTVTGSAKDLDIAVAGGGTQELRLASAGTGASAIHLNASAGGINIDSADTIDIDAADEITIDTTSADGHIAITSAHTAGQSILISANANAGSILDIDAGIVTMDVQAGISLDGADDSNLTVTGSAKDLDIAVAGGGTQELRLASGGTGASAISLTASAGGITFNCSEGKLILTLAAIPDHADDEGDPGDLSAGTLYRSGTTLLIAN